MARSTFPMSARRTISQRWVPSAGSRTILVVPLRQQGELIGALFARRIEVRPFTPAQIKLLETFADQAVIAIENVRLFKELDERTNELTRSVGELKALGEVGQAVSSTLDLETVLRASFPRGPVQRNRRRGDLRIRRAVGRVSSARNGSYGRGTHQCASANPPRLGDGAVGRAAASREPVQVPNILEERDLRAAHACRCWRASVSVPA